MLIENNANVNAVDKSGHTALDAAADANSPQGKFAIEGEFIAIALHSTITDWNSLRASRSDQFVKSTWSSL